MGICNTMPYKGRDLVNTELYYYYTLYFIYFFIFKLKMIFKKRNIYCKLFKVIVKASLDFINYYFIY